MKWHLVSSRHKLGAIFATFGFVIAAAILSFSWYQNTHTFRYDLARLALILCPPSLGLMAADNAGPTMRLFAGILVAFENAFFYGLVGFALGTLLLRANTSGGYSPDGGRKGRPTRLILRSTLALGLSVLVFGLTQVFFGRPCYDCGTPFGFPFSYMEGGKRGTFGSFLWLGFFGDLALAFAASASLLWLWYRRKSLK